MTADRSAQAPAGHDRDDRWNPQQSRGVAGRVPDATGGPSAGPSNVAVVRSAVSPWSGQPRGRRCAQLVDTTPDLRKQLVGYLRRLGGGNGDGIR